MELYGLIGFPLEHSFSYKYFTKKFKEEKIDADYKNFPIENIKSLPEIIEKHSNLLGLSVTSPYKKQVIPYLDKLDISAEKVGAVNCIKIDRTNKTPVLIGYNTDVFGFTESLKLLLTSKIKTGLILGTGGAAKAVEYSLQKLDITYKFVSSSSKATNILSYSGLTKEIIKENLLIINATPLGMLPETDKFPKIPYEFINKEHTCFDLIYNPEETVFLRKSKQKGAKISNGLKMLELQAEKAWGNFNS